jgi:hypothetical protein
MTAEALDDLRSFFGMRRWEMQQTSFILAGAAKRLTRTAAASKVLIITLGAFAATQGVAQEVMGDSSTVPLVVYSGVGMVIAAISGFEAAFKFESRAVALRTLASKTYSDVENLAAAWNSEVGRRTDEEAVFAARALLDRQSKRVSEIHTLSADLGVNVPLERSEREAQRTEKRGS